MNLQIYIWHMVTRNSWATAAEVEAATILLNCNIHDDIFDTKTF
jgi:hypothetical protein